MRNFVTVLPEFFLFLTLLAGVLSEIFEKKEKVRLVGYTVVVGLVGTLIQVASLYQMGATQSFFKTFIIDGYSLFFKLILVCLTLLSSLLFLYLGNTPKIDFQQKVRSEFFLLMVAAALSGCVLASSAHLLLSFVCIQMANAVIAAMINFGKDVAKSSQVALRFLYHASISSLFMLMGAALLFATTQTLNIYEIHEAIVNGRVGDFQLLCVFFLFFLALIFQTMCFPFHLWAADVFTEVSSLVSLFLVPFLRIVGFSFLVKIFLIIFSAPTESEGVWAVLVVKQWPYILSVVALLTMLAGALHAFHQREFKKLITGILVFLSGFYLIGMISLDQIGIAGILYGIAAETAAIAGCYFCFGVLEKEGYEEQERPKLSPLSLRPVETTVLVFCLLALLGFLPSGGFVSKAVLVTSAMHHENYLVAFVALIAAVICFASILRFLFRLVGGFQGVQEISFSGLAYTRVWAINILYFIIPSLLLFIFAQKFFGFASRSSSFIFW